MSGQLETETFDRILPEIEEKPIAIPISAAFAGRVLSIEYPSQLNDTSDEFM